MKTKTNQVSLRKEFREEFTDKFDDGVVHANEDAVFNWFHSKLTQILEGLPCEGEDVLKPKKVSWHGVNGYNQHCKEIKQYRDKILKVLN